MTDGDVELRYTFGSHHVARPEDWRVRPLQHVEFLRQPLGSLDRNPALDVPPPHHQM